MFAEKFCSQFQKSSQDGIHANAHICAVKVSPGRKCSVQCPPKFNAVTLTMHSSLRSPWWRQTHRSQRSWYTQLCFGILDDYDPNKVHVGKRDPTTARVHCPHRLRKFYLPCSLRRPWLAHVKQIFGGLRWCKILWWKPKHRCYRDSVPGPRSQSL
jgi:hypothetical protein